MNRQEGESKRRRELVTFVDAEHTWFGFQRGDPGCNLDLVRSLHQQAGKFSERVLEMARSPVLDARFLALGINPETMESLDDPMTYINGVSNSDSRAELGELFAGAKVTIEDELARRSKRQIPPDTPTQK
jgi:hypothetical protein